MNCALPNQNQKPARALIAGVIIVMGFFILRDSIFGLSSLLLDVREYVGRGDGDEIPRDGHVLVDEKDEVDGIQEDDSTSSNHKGKKTHTSSLNEGVEVDREEEEEEEEDDDDERTPTDAARRPNSTTKITREQQRLPPRRNVLFIKIPKVGGTTLAEIFERNARECGFRLPLPPAELPRGEVDSVATCFGSEEQRESAWKKFVWKNNGTLGMFAFHACFQEAMRESKYWTQKRRPFTVALMRDPWEQFVSKYRFTKYCCEVSHSPWCSALCGSRLSSFVTYVEATCGAGLLPQTRKPADYPNCNVQKRYLGGISSDPKSIIKKYDLILTLERFNEGLAMMHVLFGVPRRFSSLPWAMVNRNTLIEQPEVSDALKATVRRRHLGQDNKLYRAVDEHLDEMLKGMSPKQSTKFQEVLTRLKRVNELIAAKCPEECAAHLSLTRKRKRCDEQCLTRILKELGEM